MRSLVPGLARLCSLLALCGAVFVAPGSAAAAPRYRVTLTTLSAGEDAFERFGHTVLTIEDK